MNDYSLKQLDESAAAAIRELFVRVFSNEPWNDDWSDKEQLELYIHDLIGQSNSLTFGLYEGSELVGISMGRTKHWCTGTEYCIDELCVHPEKQGKGLGRRFAAEIETACRKLGLRYLFLLTEDNVPAFDFYRKLGFYQLEHNVAFAKKL